MGPEPIQQHRLIAAHVQTELTKLGLKADHRVTLDAFLGVIDKFVIVWLLSLGDVTLEEGQCDQLLLGARQRFFACGVLVLQCQSSFAIRFRHLEVMSHQVEERHGLDSWSPLARLGIIPLES